MSSQSVQGAPNPLDGITTAKLAGQENKGLPKYSKALASQQSSVKDAISKESTNCKCSGIALALLAILAAAGAATLIAFSGGPNNAQLFFPGVVFGVVSLGMTIYLIVVIVKSMRFKQNQKSTHTALADKKVAPKEIVEEMKKADPTQIHYAMDAFTEEQRIAYMQHVNDTFFKEEAVEEEGSEGGLKPTKKELTEEEKKMLEAFVRYPKALNQLDYKAIHRDFAVQILAHIDPGTIEKVGGPVLIKKLAVKVGALKNAEEVVIFARHPKLIAHLAQNDSKNFPNIAVERVFIKMNQAERTKFLKLMADDLAKLKEQHGEDNDTTEAQGIINGVIKLCIENALTTEFAENFKSKAEDEEAEGPSELDKALLAQVARWPEIAGERVYLTVGVPLDRHREFVSALYDAMSEEQQKAMVDSLVAKIEDGDETGRKMVSDLSYFDEKRLPTPAILVFARLPKAWAYAKNQPLSEAVETGNVVLVEAKMIEKDKQEYSKRTAELDMQKFMKGKDSYLQSLATDPTISREGSAPALYYAKYPERFKAEVIDNEKISTEPKVRYALALDLLEHMGEAAETVIYSMQYRVMGWDPMTSLFEILFADAKSAEVKTVSETRAQLFARFYYGKLNTRMSGDVTIISKVGSITKGEPTTLKKFKEIAEKQKAHVWKAK